MSNELEAGRIEVGQTYRETLVVDDRVVEEFASFSGDRNPIHIDAAEARSYGFTRSVAHGAILIAALSRIIGMKLPGPGAVWISQEVEWKKPVFVGDEIELLATVVSFSRAAGIIVLEVGARNGKGEKVMSGSGKVKIAERVSGKNEVDTMVKRTVLITGGSRGIGAEVARYLAGLGWSVAVNFRESQNAAEQLVNEINSRGGDAACFGADVADELSAKNIVGHVLDRWGRLDAVVHCATPPIKQNGITELAYSDIEEYLRVYVGGALTLMQAAVPGMQEREFGRFVFLGTAVLFGAPPAGWGAYNVAKSALEGLVKSSAVELGSMGITVNMVSPGLTVTDLTNDIPTRTKEVEARRNPMRRLAGERDSAALVSYLLSSEGSYMNGVNLPLTGGPV